MSTHFAFDPAMTDADWDAARRLAAAMTATGNERGDDTKSTGTEPETNAK